MKKKSFKNHVKITHILKKVSVEVNLHVKIFVATN